MRTHSKYFILLFLILHQANLSAICGNPIFVKADATGLNDGTSWADAHTDLQVALDEAKLCQPSIQQIWVAYGNYKPNVDISGGTSSGEKNLVFFIDFDVELYGGFCGWESSTDQRTKYLCPTILNGDHDENDLLITNTNDPKFPIDSVSDNSYNVMRLKCLSDATTIDEFTIRGGRAFHSNTFSKQTGGGIYVDGNSCETSLRISNCIFEHNSAGRAGGAIFQYFKNSSLYNPKVINNIFRYNYSQLVGGAIGGQTHAGTGAPLIQNCLFHQNKTFGGGGAIGISALSTGVVSHKIENCTFYANWSDNFGGAISISTEVSVPDQVTITNSIFNNNIGAETVYIDNTNVFFSHCIYPESDNTNSNSRIPPRFQSIFYQDFRLKKGSNGIDQGSPLAGNLYDLNGNKRSINQIDIGAYEYLACPSDNYIYVNDDNISSSGDGSSIEEAVGNLNMALEMVCDCDSIPTIDIAVGTYIPSRDANFKPDGFFNTFPLKCSANIIGQNPRFGQSTLCSGDIFRNDRSSTTNTKVFDDNISKIWQIQSEQKDTILCHFERVNFTGGSIAINNRPRRNGSELNLNRCEFYNNSRIGLNSTISNTVVRGDTAAYHFNITSCKFTDNGNERGFSTPDIIGIGNSTKVTATITSSSFVRNHGYALNFQGSDGSSLLIKDSDFIGDLSDQSGLIQAFIINGGTSNLEIKNSLISQLSNNRSPIIKLNQDGDLRTSITNCTFSDLNLNANTGTMIKATGGLGNVNIANSIFWNILGIPFDIGTTSFGFSHSLTSRDCDAIGIDCDNTIIENATNPFDTTSITTYGGNIPISARLNTNSDARDTGNNLLINNNEEDKRGRYRIQNNIVDMGAYEYTLPCTSHLILDTNQAPFIENKGVYGTWLAADTITVIGDLHSSDLTYLTLIAPNVIINGSYERSGGGILDIYNTPCPTP